MKDRVIACRGVKVLVVSPGPVDPQYPDEIRSWTVMIEQDTNSTLDVVVAWYKTRADARRHAKKLRSALKVTLNGPVEPRCGH